MNVSLDRMLGLIALGLMVLAPVQAAAPRYHYLTSASVGPIELLAPPPAPGSPEQAADLETTARVYAATSPAEHARAAGEVRFTVFAFAPAIGAWFAPGRFPRTEALFKHVHDDAKAVTRMPKNHWQRLRPYHVAPERFPDAIEHEDRTDYSYPSGHSTRGTVDALVLAELFPRQREAILAKGRDTGWLRVEGGVHYPTDIYAGRVLGQAIFHALQASPQFQADLAAARAEWASVPEAAALR